MEDKCNRCGQLELLITQIFKATGYMDLYDGDMDMMSMVITQGIHKDHEALKLYREAGREAIKALDIQLIPGVTNGPFI
jgi:hypothetical protein